VATKLDDIINDTKTYPDETTIRLADGVETTLKDLRAGYLKDADYRRKTADVARQRTELDQARLRHTQEVQEAEARLQQLAGQIIQQQGPNAQPDEVIEAIRSNPVARRLAEEVDQLKALVAPLARSVLEIDNRFKNNQLQALTNQHRVVLHAIKQQDPGLNEQELIQFAKDNYVPRLDLAYKLMTYEKAVEGKVAEAREKASKEGYERGRREAAAPVIPLRTTPQPAPGAPATLDEAVNKALADPEVIGPLVGMSRG
jgi:hypothetical protein